MKLPLTLTISLLLLINGCASEPSEFEQKKRWLERNYPTPKHKKSKKPLQTSTKQSADKSQPHTR